ncbi:MAG TPA: FkbM family methyltransferase [Opitutus sp.]|nr:FkbM family methyltransferase [Opitutus sp.]
MILDRLFKATRLELLPVHVLGGVAKGARWTLYPWTAYWRGTQEPALHEVLAGLGDIRGWNCWDIGAHFGIYAVGLAARVGESGEVAAFEPNPASFARLERHRQMNRLHWLKSFQAAVSDVAGTAALCTYGDLKSTTTHLPYEGETPVTAARPVEVRTLVLDDLVGSGCLRPPDLMKVDVEGHAHHALAGARQTLSRHRPILIVGFHSEAEVQGVQSLLQPLGYTTRLIGPGPATTWIGNDVLFTPATPA